MFHIVLTIIFSFIFSQSIQSATEQIDVIAVKPYTAQQHFQDIKMLLEPLKYKDHEIGFFESKKRALNQSIDVLNKLFEEDCTKDSQQDFLISSIPLIGVLIHNEELIIPGNKSLYFYEQFNALVKKRNEELDRLKKENQNTINLENSIENKTNN